LSSCSIKHDDDDDDINFVSIKYLLLLQINKITPP